MTNPRLFWHLIKFHLISVPWFLWAIVVGFVVIFSGVFWVLTISSGVFSNARLGSTTLNSGNNILSFFYLFILATQVSWGMQTQASVRAGHQTWVTGSHDFLRTRAVDRGVLFWSKLVIFFALCSLVWVMVSGTSFFQPPVHVELYGSSRDRQFQKALVDTPSLEARIINQDDKGRATIELVKGTGILAGLCGTKVMLVSLVALLFFVALRLPGPWLIGGFVLILVLWLSISLGSMWAKGGWLESLDYRSQVIFYARHPLEIWTSILTFGGIVVWLARRSYLRP